MIKLQKYLYVSISLMYLQSGENYMRKKILNKGIVFTIILLFIGASFTSSISGEMNDIIDLHDYIKDNNVMVNVENEGEITRLDYNVNGCNIENLFINGIKYIRIAIKGESNIMKKGYPDLPSICRSIIIPDDTKMDVKVIFSEYEDIENILIAPSKGVLPRTIDPKTVPYEFNKIYNNNEWFPNNIVKLNEPYILRDFRGQVVEVYPFQYNPSTKTLRIYSSLSIEVYPISPGEINVYTRKEPLNSLDSDFKSNYEHHFINFDYIDYNLINANFPNQKINQFYTPVDEIGNMLVICYDDFYSAMEPLILWKNMKGISTEIVKLSDVGTQSSDIDTYIENYYDTNGLTFVLLVGDASQVPTQYLGGTASDPSYSFIVGNDHYSDLFIGRFSAENIAQVETQVERTINYEKYPLSGGDWYHKGIGIASDDGSGNGDDGEWDWEHLRNIRTLLMDYTYTIVDELYEGSQGGEDESGNPSSSMVTTAANEGRSIINYCGHGSTTSWGTTGFSNSNVNALINDNMLPFIISVACYNGNFVSSTCFAEAWQRATNNGEPTGSIANFMSTISQAWNPPMDAQDEFNDILVESYSNNKKNTFGGLTANACMHMNDEYGSSGFSETDAWTVFGDPSVQVRTDTPSSMVVQHDSVMETSSTSFDVIVVGLEDALCAISRNGELIGCEYTDGSGHANIQFDGPIGEPGLVDFVVTAYNKIPYITTIEILSIDFSWDPDYPNTGNPVFFEDQSGGNIVNWYWDFGDGDYSTDQNPTHIYTVEGIYNVELTITKSGGAVHSIDKDIEIKLRYLKNILEIIHLYVSMVAVLGTLMGL
jgi:hypothetical protein